MSAEVRSDLRHKWKRVDENFGGEVLCVVCGCRDDYMARDNDDCPGKLVEWENAETYSVVRNKRSRSVSERCCHHCKKPGGFWDYSRGEPPTAKDV